MQPFAFNTTPQIRFGPGIAADLSGQLPPSFRARLLFVTDGGLRAHGLCDAALVSLRTRGEVTVFDAVEADPSVATVMQCAELARDIGATAVVGFGGGSPMDVAKVTALLVGSDEPLDEAWGVDNAHGPRLPLALVPTTAGTGSEVTPVSILTVGGTEKRGVVSPLILPDVAVLDPDLTLGLPGATTAATGIDAMVHAIEAYTSRSPNNNPLSRGLAVQALGLLGGHIRDAVVDPSNRAARSGMLLGSMLAGQAFANAPVAAVHALAYPVGGMFHIPHGLSNALVLTQVMQFNALECGAEYAALAPHLFPGISGGGSQEICARLIDGLAALSRDLGLPRRLRDVNIPAEALPQMAAEAMKQTRLLVNNPRPLDEADALSIYQAAW